MAVTILRQAENKTEALNEIEADVTAEDAQRKTKAARTFSSIGFPYADLSDALKVASTIRDKGGAPMSKDQLAPAIGHAASSGAFSAKINAARMFGLVQFSDEKIKLTELGFEAIDSDDNRARVAKVKSFLSVPLFEKTYTEFRNRQLPPRPHGLEQAFIGFGVIASRATNARWSFDRSAKQAGFFETGDDRLVEPVLRAAPNVTVNNRIVPPPPLPDLPVIADKAMVFSAGASELLIKGLLDIMPAPGEKWSINERSRWLRALAVNLSMIYGADNEGEIDVKPQKNQVSPTEASSKPVAAPTPAAPTAPHLPTKQPSMRPSSELDDEIPF